MTQLERDALICLYYQNYGPLKRLALCATVELDPGIPTTYPIESADTYLSVLEGMVAKGWLKIVRQSARKRRAQWLERGWLVPEEYYFADKGDLDFTRKGFALYGGAGRDDCLVYRDEVNRTLNCIRRSAVLCEEWLADERDPVMGSLLNYVGGGVVMTSIDMPETVGKWFKNVG